MTRVEVKPELLRWARERARLPLDKLRRKFPHIDQWEAGVRKPTLKQLEGFASATHAPIGYLFLQEPPAEPLPIPDFRTMGGLEIERPSPDLIEMILACQERQDWFRDYAIATGEQRLPFIGSANLDSPVGDVAAAIRQTLNFNLDERRKFPTWAEALRAFILAADNAGILVMCSGIVMNNTHRKLDPKEFRGFALADSLAPLVFINGSDSKSAQMFTLAHELAHLWLGQSAVSDTTVASRGQNAVEQWCNRVAAEMLAPMDLVVGYLRTMQQQRPGESLDMTVARMTRMFKVSTLVVLLRLREAGYLSWEQFDAAYNAELLRLANLPKQSNGGDFYLTAAVRYSKRFTRALVESTLEGRTLYRDAFRMLGINKTETFMELGRSLAFGV